MNSGSDEKNQDQSKEICKLVLTASDYWRNDIKRVFIGFFQQSMERIALSKANTLLGMPTNRSQITYIIQ